MNTATTKKKPAKHARRAAIYARVSTFDKGQNPETQLAQLRGYAKSRGFAVAHELVDYASGRRPAELPEALRPGAQARDRRRPRLALRPLRAVARLISARYSFGLMGFRRSSSCASMINRSTNVSGDCVRVVIGVR
jgi:hypothetical protein